MIVCGFEDVREHKPAVSGKNPVHPVHRCESKIYPCLTMNRFPATKRRRLFQVSSTPALPCGSYESETGVIQARCQFLSNPCCFNLLNRFCVTRTQVLFQISPAPATTTVRITQRKNSRSSMKTNHQWTRIGTKTDGPPSTTTGAKMLLHFCPVGVTLSWEEAPPGARASRPHKSSRSFGHLLHRNQPAAAPCLCFGRAHAVPAGRAVGCNIAGKLSGNRRDSMRAGRPRSRGCRPDGEVGGIRRATSLKAGLSPLGNSRLPASRAPAPRDWADPSRRTIN